QKLRGKGSRATRRMDRRIGRKPPLCDLPKIRPAPATGAFLESQNTQLGLSGGPGGLSLIRVVSRSEATGPLRSTRPGRELLYHREFAKGGESMKGFKTVFLILASSIGAWAQPGFITTIAGTGTSGFSGDGGPAANARLNTPNGVALDDSGNIF